MDHRAKKRIALLTGLAALAVLVCITAALSGGTPGVAQTMPPRTTAGTAPTDPSRIPDRDSIELEGGLRITKLGSYSGIYMEDGSDEIVSGVLMLLVENTSDRDLQLARIELVYPDFTAEFEVTTLPAGEALVALERSRREAPAEEPQAVQTRNVVFFEAPMELYEDRIGIQGVDSYLDVTNLSREDIQGDFYIYYKNSAADLLYGGITYRVRVGGGLAAGETVRVIAGHYSPDSSRILMITGLEG